jgi:hypothetical protein
MHLPLGFEWSGVPENMEAGWVGETYFRTFAKYNRTHMWHVACVNEVSNCRFFFSFVELLS